MSRTELFLGLTLALALRFGFVVYATHRAPITPDTGDYGPIARNLLDYGEYSIEKGVPTAEREPGYVLFVTAVFGGISRSPWAVTTVQSVLGAATAWLVYLLAASLFGAASARIAFWGCVFYPYFIYYPAYFYRETYCAFLLTLCLTLLVRFQGTTATWAAGMVAALLGLSNLAWAPACALLAPVSWLMLRNGRWDMRRTLLFVAPLLFFSGAWVLRNWMVFHTFIPGSTLVGNQIYTTLTIPYESLGTAEQVRIQAADPITERVGRLSGLETHRVFMRENMRIVRNDPVGFIRGAAGRFFKLWRIFPHQRNYAHDYNRLRLAALFSDGWIVPMGLLAIFLERKNKVVLGYFVLVLVGVTLMFSISNAPIRYRVPLMPLMLVLAGQGIWKTWGHLKSALQDNHAQAKQS